MENIERAIMYCWDSWAITWWENSASALGFPTRTRDTTAPSTGERIWSSAMARRNQWI